jgi:hypothetical protein
LLVRTRRQFRPILVALEDRTTPSLVVNLTRGGELKSVTADSAGQQADMTLNVLPGNQVQVLDGTADLGTFPVGRKLTISPGSVGASLVDRLVLNENALNTNLNIQLGSNPTGTTVQFQVLGGSVGHGGTGTVNGNVSFKSGDGDQLFMFGEYNEPVGHLVNVNGSVGIDFGKNYSAGADGDPVDAFFCAGVVTYSLLGQPNPVYTFANISGLLQVNNGTACDPVGTVGGDLKYSSPKSVAQTLTLGNNGMPFTLQGSLSVRTGDGPDLVSLRGADLRGKVTINTGNGDDTVLLGTDFYSSFGTSIGGNATIKTGAGNDTVQFSDTAGVNSVVGGKLMVQTGDGDDTVNLLGLEVRGKKMSVETGNGNDRVTLTSLTAPSTKLTLKMGSGTDTITLEPGASLKVASLKVTGDDVTETGSAPI